jgi:hypothetical protein
VSHEQPLRRTLLIAAAIGGGLSAIWHVGMRRVARSRAYEKAKPPGDAQVVVPELEPLPDTAEELAARARRVRRRIDATYMLAGAAAAGVLALTARRPLPLGGFAVLAVLISRPLKTLAPLLTVASAPMSIALQRAPRFAPAAVAAGYGIVVALGAAYDARLFSDAFFRHTFAWTFLSCWYARRPALAPLTFVAVASALMPMLRRAARRHAPAHLLVLRAYGPGARTEQLMETVGRQWRTIGPIHLLAAPDSVVTNLDLGEFARMFTGRSRTMYARALPDDLLDRDGTWRINDVFRHGDSWQQTVADLVGRSHAILMDGSAEGERNEGIRWERELLRANGRTCIEASSAHDLLGDLCRNAFAPRRVP